MRIRCKTLAEGPGPHEAIVAIATSAGRREQVVVSTDLIRRNTIEVARIAESGGAWLIELPRESANGNWRIWVDGREIAG